MTKQQNITIDGKVVDVLGTFYRVELDNGITVDAYRCGKMCSAVGDRVKVELSPYDLTKGRIVYRYR